VACRRDRWTPFKGLIGSLAELIEQEYRTTDPGIEPSSIEKKGPVKPRTAVASLKTIRPLVVNLLAALPSGPVEMTEAFPLWCRRPSTCPWWR
jgi:hypothetical protein